MTTDSATSAPPVGDDGELFLRLIEEIGGLVNSAAQLDELLDGIVKRIAKALHFDVVSIYLWRPELDALELRATCGLTLPPGRAIRLKPGEGLTGMVFAEERRLTAMPASEHPSYRYFPELGEEVYDSYLGVPIMLRNECLGVLVGQIAERRRLHTAEQTLFGIVADRVAALLIVADRFDRGAVTGDGRGERRVLNGRGISPGSAVGRAFLPQGLFGELSARAARAVKPGKPEEELRRFEDAVAEAEHSIADLVSRLETQGLLAEGEIAIFRAHLDLLRDRGFQAPISERIVAGETAERAVVAGVEKIARQFEQLEDRYLRDRGHDFRDLGAKILERLASQRGDTTGDTDVVGEGAVLVAAELVPAYLVAHHRERIAAIVTERDGATSHTAILAQSLGIPAVGGVPHLIEAVRSGDTVLVDGSGGVVFVRPEPQLVDAYAAAERRRREIFQRIEAASRAGAGSGVALGLLANVGLPVDVEHAREQRLDEVGLLRTELLFLGMSRWPSVAEQTELYASVAKRVSGRVTIRTLDVGGEKTPAYVRLPRERNPLLGLRAVRYSMEHLDQFHDQLQAIVAVARDGYPVRVLLPLVTRLWEVQTAREILNELVQKSGLKAAQAPSLGVMLEAPALLYQMDDLKQWIDFVAIGTNDFVQYLLAVDRASSTVGHLYSPFHPAVVRALSFARSELQAAELECSVCGDLAGQPLGALLLLALGYRRLSVIPQRAPLIRYLAERVDEDGLLSLRAALLGEPQEDEIRRLLQATVEAQAPLLLEEA